MGKKKQKNLSSFLRVNEDLFKPSKQTVYLFIQSSASKRPKEELAMKPERSQEPLQVLSDLKGFEIWQDPGWFLRPLGFHDEVLFGLFEAEL